MDQTYISADMVAQAVERAIPELACGLRGDYRSALQEARQAAVGAAAGGDAGLERAALVLEQLLRNAELADSEQVPLCQDTGYVWVLLEVGGDACVGADVFSGVDAAVARAYQACGLRKSLVRDALLDRSNSSDNTPAFCELKLTAACSRPQAAQAYATLHVMLKGGGSDNASRVVMLPPGAGVAGVEDCILQAVQEKAANACPPLVVGVGIGTTFDKVAGLAKQALLRPVGSANGLPQLDELEQRLLARINALGIGPGGFGGGPTALAVHLKTAPCHIAALPVAVNIGCNAMRSTSIDLLA